MNLTDSTAKSSSIPSLEENHYYMFNDEFNAKTCGDAIKFIIQRNLMEPHLQPKCIKFIIMSPGGHVQPMFALVDTIKGSKIPIYTYGLGEISSCGLLTFIAGEKGHRYITRNTTIMSHQFFAGSIGKHHELMASMKEFKNVDDRLMTHYKKCTGLNEEKIRKYLLPPQDVYLTADEAIKYGVADSIVEFY